MMEDLRRMAHGDQSALFSALMKSNRSFASFVQANQGKTPEQAFRDYGLDFGKVTGMLR